MADLTELVAEMSAPDSGVEVADRRYLLRTYIDVFIGKDGCVMAEALAYSGTRAGSHAVDWLVKAGHAVSREQAVVLGDSLIRGGLVHHCVDPRKPFLDGNFFYRFSVSLETSFSAPAVLLSL